jgi:hypothetical protein
MWYQALSNPAYNPIAGTYPVQENEDQWIYTLKPGPWWALVGGEQSLRRYFPQGSWETGDITVAFNESSSPLTIYDKVVPLGNQTAPANLQDARTFTQKETIVRAGQSTIVQTGTITATGTAVVGVGTAFSSSLLAGDIIAVAGLFYAVAAVTDNTHLTLAAAPVTNYAGIAFAKAVDWTLYNPVVQILAIQDASTTYVAGTDFIVSSEQKAVQWINPAHMPAAGDGYSIMYTYRPTYIVEPLVQKDQIVKGLPGLSVEMAKLFKPDTLKR